MSITYINKQGIIDDVEKRLQTEIDTHELNTTNPHSVTAAQVSAVPLTSIVDNLITDDATKVLSAKQGKELEDKKVDKNNAITAGTKAKITYDSKGLVTSGADLEEADIPTLSASKITQTTTARFVTDTEKSTWNGKQDALTFDTSPTSGSTNPVTSGGVYTAISAIETTIAGIEDLLEAI